MREELDKIGVEKTRQNIISMGDEIRSKEGVGGLAKRIIKKIEQGKNYVIGSIRHPGEVEELRKTGRFFLVAIQADPKIRFERVKSRNREKDPRTFEEFMKVDRHDADSKNEFSLQTAKCMEMADFVVTNEAGVKEFEKQLEALLEKVKENA